MRRLNKRQWMALVRLCDAGSEGIPMDVLLYGKGGFSWQPTLARLYHYQPEPLMEYVANRIYRISTAGQEFYQEHLEEYSKLYPDAVSSSDLSSS